MQAAPDGLHVLEVSVSNAWTPMIYKNLNFNFIRDIAAIASVRRAAGVMEVNPSVPAKTVPELHCLCQSEFGQNQHGDSRRG